MSWLVLACAVLLSPYSNSEHVPAKAPTVKLLSGAAMPALGLGTWLGMTQQKPIEDEIYQAVRSAISNGYRLIDTARRYGVEEQVGRAIKDAISSGDVTREELFITTKLWNDAHRRSAVVPALRESLKDLDLEYVDLYLVHWPISHLSNKTFEVVDYTETWSGMLEARTLGLTRHIGVSNYNISQIMRSAKEGDMPEVLQVEINLTLQQPTLLAWCRSHNVTVMGYSPFGALFPSRSHLAPGPRVDTSELLDIANKYNKTVPQLVLRYLHELGVIPIPKSVHTPRIIENIDIFDFALTDSDREQLRSYNKDTRTLPQHKWKTHPFYPFGELLKDN